MNETVRPDPEDYEAVRQQFGRSRKDATDEELAEHYRLARANKLIRSQTR
jgi:hypothetical protein